MFLIFSYNPNKYYYIESKYINNKINKNQNKNIIYSQTQWEGEERASDWGKKRSKKRDSEWMEAAAVRSGAFGGGVEWVGGRWQPDRWLAVAASALESLVEHGLWLVVKIRARRCMAGDQRGGLVMRKGWAEIWVDRCLWVLGVWRARDLGSGPAWSKLG